MKGPGNRKTRHVSASRLRDLLAMVKQQAKTIVAQRADAERLEGACIEAGSELAKANSLILELTDERDRLASELTRARLTNDAEHHARRRDVAQVAALLAEYASGTRRAAL